MSDQNTKVYTPLPPPPTTLQSDPRETLTETELGQYDEVLVHFTKDEYKLPGQDPAMELEEAEKFWLSRECLLRYLRASKWKTDAAIQRLEQTLKWRREFGLYDRIVTTSRVEPEAVTGKEVLFGYDMENRPAFYMFPSRQNTTEAEGQIQFVVWMLERCIDLMSPGVETLDLLINYADKAKGPTMSTSMAVLNILQDHYPERLGLALVINLPFLLNAFYKCISPFIDPITRKKLCFNVDIVKDKTFAPEQAMSKWWGGSQDFEYDHDKYWPALVQLAESRRNSWMDKWRELGGKVGIKEWDYKGAIAVPGNDVAAAVVEEKVVTAAVMEQGVTAFAQEKEITTVVEAKDTTESTA
ncbi:CRAL/TRIO domain-containing protein [Pluteus cervinus]|uniref:CRAL/TRIO domain-containing protein n=1 Tax=Pluteus cervinus TaxID=181527 RepID=A0ACD3BBW3_9AGAR|nr:CRAL/TRIO domain-containing protein [Pluteus cervinus]